MRLDELIFENPKSKIKVIQAKENQTGKYPFYTSGINIYRYDEALVDGDNIYLATGGNAIVQFYSGQSAYSTDTYVIKSKDEKICSTQFLYIILKHLTQFINDFLFKGMGLKHLQKKEFKNLSIPLPPLKIQEQIVQECEKVQKQYNTLRMSIKEYEKLIKAVLEKCGIIDAGGGYELNFVLEKLQNLEKGFDFEFLTLLNKGQSFTSKEQKNSYFKDFSKRIKECLKTLPLPPEQGWEKIKLGEIGKICMCKRIFKHQTKEIDQIPFYKISTFGASADAYIDREIYEDYKNKYSFPKKGEVLISAAGSLGKVVVYDGKPAYFQDSNIVWISNNEKKVSNRFLYIVYKNINWHQYKTEGSVIERLYNNDISKIQISIPSIQKQETIIKIIKIIQDQITFIQAKSELLKDQNRQILQKYLFS